MLMGVFFLRINHLFLKIPPVLLQYIIQPKAELSQHLVHTFTNKVQNYN